jgi:acyl-CoA synthetase (AMP-forming)/AMP-acid ligase II
VIRNGWLKTGDIAYMDEDGYIFIQGRESDIIKSGGHRINPNDIEEAIAELAGVSEVVVVGVNDEILGQTIKAVIVPRPGASVDTMAIKAHCLRRLPAYKVPKHIEFNTELPRTASGKVRRFLLASKN